MNLIAFFVALSFSSILFSASGKSDDLVVKNSRESHSYLGFGAQIWHNELTPTHLQALKSLKSNFTRIGVAHWNHPGPTQRLESLGFLKNAPKTKAEVEQAVEAAIFSQEQHEKWIQAFKKLRYETGINQIVLTQFDFPDAWFTDIKVPPFSWMEPFWPQTQLPGSNIEEHNLDLMVWYWTSVIKNLKNYADAAPMSFWIEIANEPDGYWNTYISPQIYKKIIERLRLELNWMGASDVKVMGPGLAYLAHPQVNFSWIREMSASTVASLDSWSSHAWDEILNKNLPGFLLERTFQNFFNFARQTEMTYGMSKKPVIITEFASAVLSYQGYHYPKIGDKQDDPITNLPIYGLRVLANFLSMTRSGAAASIYWELADPVWSDSNWGLLKRKTLEPRPVFEALKSLTPYVTPGMAVVPVDSNSDPSELVFASFQREGEVILSIVNLMPFPKTLTIDFDWNRNLKLKKISSYQNGKHFESLATWNQQQQKELDIAPESALTLIYSK